MTHIKTAVFPVAGLGSRFFPITKTVPKEMLPLIDRQLIWKTTCFAIRKMVNCGRFS